MSSCPVEVWSIDLETERSLCLVPEEEVRAARFRFEKDRLHWANARSALRRILAARARCSPLDLQFAYGEHGKPSLAGRPEIEFNISHSRGKAMVAVTRGVPVGIDLEVIRESVDIAKLLQRIGETQLTGTPAELFHIWTRREARTKAVGGPLMEIPSEDLRVIDLLAPEGFAASLALAGANPQPHYRDAADLA